MIFVRSTETCMQFCTPHLECPPRFVSRSNPASKDRTLHLLWSDLIARSPEMAPSIEAETSLSQPGPKLASSLSNVVHATGLFPRNGPDSTARSWGHHSSGVTFAAQHKLPKQPLPTLDLSCQRYLDVLKPLYSPEGWEASQAAVRRFVQGEGPILQAQLEAYNEIQANYFEHFCESLPSPLTGRRGRIPDSGSQAMNPSWEMIHVSNHRT